MKVYEEWHRPEIRVDESQISAFLTDLWDVCKKHRLYLSSGDGDVEIEPLESNQDEAHLKGFIEALNPFTGYCPNAATIEAGPAQRVLVYPPIDKVFVGRYGGECWADRKMFLPEAADPIPDQFFEEPK